MSVAIFDRFAMGSSLGVHIVLASIGIALPLIIAVAEYIGIKNKDQYYLIMAKRLTTILIILFAIGTASGTLVAVNLLFLWPKFMALVGNVAIFPVYVEVFAFFGEAIFLAIYVYSYNKFEYRYSHVFLMVLVSFFAAASGVLITMLNAFMNNPVGFDVQAYLRNGTITAVNPMQVVASPPAALEIAHVLSTAYFAGSFIFAAYFAYMLLRSNGGAAKQYYKKGLKVVLIVAVVATVLSLYTGIASISSLLTTQPEKYAAIELDLVSRAHAPEYIGGIYANNTIQYGIPIPDLQSILATGSASGVVPGLNQFPQSTWPPLIVHLMFDALVGGGFAVGGFLFLLILLKTLKVDVFENKILLKLLVLAGFVAVLLLEDGWIMAEVARQPWIIYNVMTVEQAANQSPSIIPLAIGIVIFYLAVIPFTIIVLKRIFTNRPLENELTGV